MSKKGESEIVISVLRVLRERGAWAVKLHGGPTQQAGLPDVLAIYRGTAFGIEVKKPGCKPTRIQEHTLEKMRQRGAAVGVVTSAAEAIQLLEATHPLESLPKS